MYCTALTLRLDPNRSYWSETLYCTAAVVLNKIHCVRVINTKSYWCRMRAAGANFFEYERKTRERFIMLYQNQLRFGLL